MYSQLEIKWNAEWFKLDNGYWTKKENQQIFLNSLKSRFNIKENKDWGKVLSLDKKVGSITSSQILEAGGYSLLNLHHGSVYATLKNAYYGILISFNF